MYPARSAAVTPSSDFTSFVSSVAASSDAGLHAATIPRAATTETARQEAFT
jgi:hypothetical protein